MNVSIKNDKNIFVYWDKGLSNATYLIKVCVSSWKIHNPDWNLIVLDSNNLNLYIDMDDVRNKNPELTIEAFSDLLRVRLLRKYGGVWVDATTYCNCPLSNWITEFQFDGVFFFKSNSLDVFGSWFIYAKKDSYLISKLCEEEERFLVKYSGFKHYMNIRFFWRIWKAMELWLGRYNYYFWRLASIRIVFGVSPYFFSHYLLGYLISEYKQIDQIYSNIKNIDVERPHDFQIYGLIKNAKLPEFVLQDFYNRNVPVYKMSYKRDLDLWKENGVFAMLEDNIR